MPILTPHFTQKTTLKEQHGGPSHAEQLQARANGSDWVLLNLHLLKACQGNNELSNKVNAFKHALQIYGPQSGNLPDLRYSKCDKVKGIFFHGHVECRSTYVLEWAILDAKQRIMVLTGFGTHENFQYTNKLITIDKKKTYMSHAGNQRTMAAAELARKGAKEKVERLNRKHPNTPRAV